MKIRKLLSTAKLKLIEKQNPNIFVFHCSLNAAQWRDVKNFLYNNGKTLGTQKMSDNSEQQSSQAIRGAISYGVFFSSKSCSIYSSGTKSLKKSSQLQFKPAGCLFFFHQHVADTFGNQNRLTPFELLKKLESSDPGAGLILLYGHMNSTVLNHIDLKRALNLETQETYQQLLLSIQSLSHVLNDCLYRKINEFFWIQEISAHQSSRTNSIEANNGN